MVFKVGAVLALVVLGTLAEIVTGTVVALGAVLAGIGLAIIYVQLRGREQGRGRGNGAVIITALVGGRRWNQTPSPPSIRRTPYMIQLCPRDCAGMHRQNRAERKRSGAQSQINRLLTLGRKPLLGVFPLAVT